MTYKKNIFNMIVSVICMVVFVATAIYCVPRFSLLSSHALSAVVSSADKNGTSGYAILKADGTREDGGTMFFHYYYPGSKSHLKQDEKVLVGGSITFMDESTEQEVNSTLVIGTKMPVLICMALSIFGLVGVICLLPVSIRNFFRKPWDSSEEQEVKAQSVNALYTTEILMLVVALIFFAAGITQVPGYVFKENHTTGIVTYQSSRQSSEYVKVHTGNSVRAYKSRYGKGIRPTYAVLQIKADSPVNGADTFWYEGNCTVFSDKKVYIGYNDASVFVVSRTDLIVTIIGGGFLILHVISTLLLSRKNPYGGKIFWFLKF